MNNVATPAETVEPVAPAAPAPAAPAAPAEPAAAPAQASGNPSPAPAATPTPTEESVTLSKKEHDQLARDAARASGNQRKADLYDRTVGSQGGHFRTPAAPAAAPSPEEAAANAQAEDAKAARGLTALAADPAYRDVLDADPTLRNLLIQNPLAVLPVYASDAVDADDAVGLVKEALEGLKKPAEATPPAEPAAPAAPQVAPPAGAVNPPAAAAPNEEAYATAMKDPNTENALIGMIGAKITGGQVS